MPSTAAKAAPPCASCCGRGGRGWESGFCVVVFPEGTRMAPGEQREYFSGGALLAKTAGVPVVPVAVDSGHCWGKNQFLKRPGTITVRIGEAIPTDTMSAEEITARAKKWADHFVL